MTERQAIKRLMQIHGIRVVIEDKTKERKGYFICVYMRSIYLGCAYKNKSSDNEVRKMIRVACVTAAEATCGYLNFLYKPWLYKLFV